MELPGPPRLPSSWHAGLVLRLRRHLVLKLLGISAFMWVFFLGYFHTLGHPVFPVFQMPITSLDRLIPFQPQALAAYLSLWLYVGIAPGMLLTLREGLVYALWIGALCIAGLACFYFWPTAVPPSGIDASGHAGFSLLKGVDAAGNACPSLHIATGMFSAIWIDRLLHHLRTPTALRVFNGLWFAAIAYSTLAIKQHVVLDVVAGALLGIVFAALAVRRWTWVDVPA
ncbi:MAG: phosphatase PAP2 family protein [Gammaproteobacteria bacterium]